jgi:hypothetical protein
VLESHKTGESHEYYKGWFSHAAHLTAETAQLQRIAVTVPIAAW